MAMLRVLVAVALACPAALLQQVSAATAQTFPSRDLQFVTPGTPGSTSDIMPRAIAEELGPLLGRNVAVINKPGGSGLNSANAMLAAPADGHTLWMGTMGTLTINPYVLPSMPFDPLKAVVPVAMSATMPLVVVVNPTVTPVGDIAGLIALAKANPKKLTYGSAGAGSSMAITAAVLAKQAGVELTHVPYRGMTDGIAAVLGREITMMVPDVGVVTARIRDGSLKALAVTTAKRSPLLPDVPTLKEQGYDIDISLWYGVFVKQDTPKAAVERLATDLKTVMATPKIKQRWDQLDLIVGDRFGDDFDTFYRAEYKRWGDILVPMGIKVE